MSVLSNIDIVNAMNEDEGIIIMNMRDKSITGLGYDLTIGFIRDADTGEEPETCADDSNRYTLISGHRYLVISKEFVYIIWVYGDTAFTGFLCPEGDCCGIDDGGP